MHRTAFLARSALALLLSAGPSLAQAPAVAAPPARGAPSLAAPPAAPGSQGPEAPLGGVTQELQRKLQAMLKGNGLTADEVARRALRSSSLVSAKQKAIEAASAGVDQAESAFYPAVTLSARYSRLSDVAPSSLGSLGGDGTLIVSPNPAAHVVAPGELLLAVPVDLSFPVVLNQYVLQASLNVPVSDYVLRMSRAVAGASQARRASQLDEQAARLSVARDARVAYYQWIRSQGMAFIGAQAVAQASGHLNDANNAFQAGLLSKADVLRAQSGVKGAELFAQRASSNVGLTTARLRVMMKDPSASTYEVGENILEALAALPNTGSEETAYQEARSQRLEFKLLSAHEHALRDQAAVARAGSYPRLDAQANAQYSNPNQRYFPQEDAFHGTWDVSAVLSWAPSAIFGAQASSRAFEAKAAEVAAQRQALHDALKLEVAQALSAAKDAEFAVGVSEQALVAAEEGYRVRRELFRSGRATLVEVTDSETELTRARLEHVNAHIDFRIARVELTHVLGRDVAR